MKKEIKRSMVFDNGVPSWYKAKLIGYGDCGNCYLLDNGLVYKEFFSDALWNIKNMKDFFSMGSNLSIRDFTYLDSDLVAFPRTIIYKNEINDDNIMGYLYNYVNGDLFWDIYSSININDLISASKKLEMEILELAKKGVSLFDVNDGGVIYTKDKKLKLIDTDLFGYWNYDDPDKICESNIKEWGGYILRFLGNGRPFANEKLNDYYSYIEDGKGNPSDLIGYTLNELNKLDINVSSLGEYEEKLVHIRKK